MPKRSGPRDGVPTWTPNQVVASNLIRLRQRRRLTQGEAARQLSRFSPKEWTEPMVAHAERSVTGNRIREFTADDLVTMARAFDVPVLYFLTPPPNNYIKVPDQPVYGITPRSMLEAVLGRLDNLAEWEAILDEWDFSPDDEVPFPLSDEGRKQLRASAREVALVRAQHIVRSHFKGDLIQLHDTLYSLAHLVLTVNDNEVLADLDENEYIKRIQALRQTADKAERLTKARRTLENTSPETDADDS